MIVFCYFILHENISRAWAETNAVSKVLSSEMWEHVLSISGFHNIEIKKLKSRFFWVPSPLLIKATK
jgi:hypothetical protein